MDLSTCVLWTGRLDGEGYGLERGGKRAHVVAYEAAHGPIPRQTPRLVVRHLCHRRRCVNAAHLAIGTDADNARDRVRAGRGANQHGAATTRDRRW